jgi:hypothetical protein
MGFSATRFVVVAGMGQDRTGRGVWRPACAVTEAWPGALCRLPRGLTFVALVSSCFLVSGFRFRGVLRVDNPWPDIRCTAEWRDTRPVFNGWVARRDANVRVRGGHPCHVEYSTFGAGLSCCLHLVLEHPAVLNQKGVSPNRLSQTVGPIQPSWRRAVQGRRGIGRRRFARNWAIRRSLDPSGR